MLTTLFRYAVIYFLLEIFDFSVLIPLMPVAPARRATLVPMGAVAMAAVLLSRGWLGMLEVALEVLDAVAVVPYDLFYVANAVEVDLQLVDLRHDVLEAGDLSIGIIYQVACVVILLHSHDGTLFAEVLDALLYLLHQSVEVARQGGKTGAVEEQAALGGSTAGGAGGIGIGLGLVVTEEGDFLFGQTQLRVWNGIGLGRRHGSTAVGWLTGRSGGAY